MIDAMMRPRGCQRGRASNRGRSVVRPLSVRVLLSVVVVVLGIVASGRPPGALGQEATPAGVTIGAVTFEPVTFATGIALPSPGDRFVVRASLDPGGVVPIQATDPALGILLVEAGTLTVQVEGPMTVTRGTGLGAAMASAQATGEFHALLESVRAGQAVTLAAGDAAYIPANVAGEIRNEGQVRAERLAFLVVPSEVMTSVATPAP
jgi:quercetin dioxygenase-like cupin family protein